MTSVTCSPSLADMRAAQADHLDRMKESLREVDAKDVVPILVARRVLQSFEMSKVYDQQSPHSQMDVLIEILKTKLNWVGPMTDALIKNGKAPIAQQLIKLQTERN
ncbi:unnamed protein product, partial [Mesorhabditis belari]|uniref:CARD domain-containing protein n=1 Tax=Mesorhabditis belari TaxID=2138241 RepID=A0AAF3ELJ0_9BILA